jgi:hypothetical protein
MRLDNVIMIRTSAEKENYNIPLPLPSPVDEELNPGMFIGQLEPPLPPPSPPLLPAFPSQTPCDP